MKFSDFEGLPNDQVAHQGPLAVGNTAQTLAQIGVTLDDDTNFVAITVETADLRITVTGTTPTATLGDLKPAGSQLLLSRAEALAAKLIRAGGTNSAIQVSQFLK